MSLPSSTKYAVIGAGIHGLSTAYHLAQKLKATGKGSGRPTSSSSTRPAIAAGASGIACGVVRNNYYQPAMRELMAHSVVGLGERSQGLQLSPGRLHADQPRGDARAGRHDLRAAEGDRLRVGRSSRARPTRQNYMKGLFDDWQAKGITSVLHEKRGGYANNTRLDVRPRHQGRSARACAILTGVEVHGLRVRQRTRGAVTALMTNRGRIACDYVVVGVGPWVNAIWNMLELPKRITRQGPRRQDARRRAHVDTTGAAGRHARRRSRTSTRRMTARCRR